MPTILLVDDYLPNLRALELTFIDAGFDVLKADGLEAAKAVLRNSACDLVLSDIQMPGGSGFDLLIWIQEQGRSDLPVLLITSALPDAESRVRGLSLGAVDYVERSLGDEELVLRVRKAIESVAQLKHLKASLEDSEKLASLGRIISASHHEVKNLANIIGFSVRALHRKSPGKDPDLEALVNAASLLAEITKSLGFLLKDQPMPAQRLRISPIIQELVAMTSTMFRSIAVEIHLPSEDLWVNGSPTALRQVLLNLLLNARDAIEERGERGGLIVCEMKRAGHELQLLVRDNGVGFSRPGIKTEFPAFASTKTLKGGTGLGLWYSVRVLGPMLGRLEIASDGPARGATACVRLPLAEAKAEDLDLGPFLMDAP